MANDAKPVIPGPKPGEATPVVDPVASAPQTPVVERDPVVKPKPGDTIEPKPMHEVVSAPEADPASAQAGRAVDPAEPHDFLDEAFKRQQSGVHPSELSPAEIVASAEAAHTIGKGLNEAGDGANGMVNGDRPSGIA